MGRQLWIADKIRSYGVQVVEVAGWQTRGSSTFDPKGVIAHHTASRRGSGDASSLRICTHGRSDLPGPLCQVLLSRSGVAYIIASGRANHAGTGGAMGLAGNSSVFGIEAENDGVGEPWSVQQIEAYYRVTAALLEGIGKTGSNVVGHREWAPRRKIDPTGIDMNKFRWEVDARLKNKSGASPAPSPAPQTTSGLIKLGSRGDEVWNWQAHLNKYAGAKITVDGIFGQGTHNATVNFQRFFGLTPDGVVGQKTLGAMALAKAHQESTPAQRPTLKRGDRGEHVTHLQKKIGFVAVDGHFGDQTHYRVIKIQRNFGLAADGIVGPKTWAKVESL